MDSEFSSCDIQESMLQYDSLGPRNLSLEYLSNITNNFSDERLLGGGGFGKVYKGELPNGETIAVKKLNSSMPEVTDKQFKNEANHLMRLKHPNIVLLVGYCSETKEKYVEYEGKYIWADRSERLLCLEYMPKGNLRGYLSDECSGLTWEVRYKIIKGICYGLQYLHEERQLNAPTIHMDLKPANILLDNNMVPKIADFGLSRLFSEEKTWTCTISRDGTLGYMAPEYMKRGFISTKLDIFSLGVIIIEIVTGQRDYPDESETEITSQEFTELVLKNWRERQQKSLRYTSLETDYQQIRRCIEIGLDCVKLDHSKRPAISQVIKMLHRTETADFSCRNEVMSLTNKVRQQEHWASTSEAPLEKECQSSKRIRRSHALARLKLDRPASLAVAGSASCSLGHVNSLRIGGSGDGGWGLQRLCQSIIVSGPDDFAIPAAVWEAYNAVREAFSTLPSPEPPTPVLTRLDVKGPAAGIGGIKGVRLPPSLKPPPLMALPVVCGAGSTWDIFRSFAPATEHAPGSRPARGFGHEDAVDNDEEDAVLEDLSLGDSSEFWTANSSLSSPSGDEASSRATESILYISPNGKFGRKIQSWLKGQLLGSGSFGMVYEGISDEGFFFAVKKVNLFDQGSNMKQCIFQLEQEIARLSQFEHENIVQYYGTDKKDSKLYIFLELVTQGCLASFYQKHRLRDTDVSSFTRQILNGLTYLHERNIVHRDIKCANIMIDVNGSVKLADFGLAKEITKFNAVKACKGTVYWMAPEVVNPEKTYGPAADIWSLGCTVLEMLTCQIPYPDLEWTQALYRIGKGEAPSIPSALSKDARDFISQCVKPNPENRPSASELLKHPFLINRSMRSPI